LHTTGLNDTTLQNTSLLAETSVLEKRVASLESDLKECQRRMHKAVDGERAAVATAQRLRSNAASATPVLGSRRLSQI
jgi:hypothetical protein